MSSAWYWLRLPGGEEILNMALVTRIVIDHQRHAVSVHFADDTARGYQGDDAAAILGWIPGENPHTDAETED